MAASAKAGPAPKAKAVNSARMRSGASRRMFKR